VLSMTTGTGSFAPARSLASGITALRRDSVVWSGMPISKVISRATERSRPSVCRHGRPKARRSISPVSMATLE
jgi:hypothetical protein